MQAALIVALMAIICISVQSFVVPTIARIALSSGTQQGNDMSLDACRRNNKMEKRKRNRDYARKFKTAGGSRKDVVIEEKRAVVAKNEETFQAMVFKMTTDDDMPAYSGFEWS